MIGARFTNRAAEAIGRQLANPSGTAGALVAAALRVVNREPAHALIGALDIRPYHRVLDVGCGDGFMLSLMNDVAWRCGVDRSGTMLAMAAKRLRRPIREGRASVQHGDMMNLPDGRDTFDRITASNVLYFCPDIPRFIDECRRVGRPRALLGIYVTSAKSMAKWPFAGATTHRHFSEQQLAAELSSAGIRHREIIRVALPTNVEGLIAVASLA